MNRSFLAHSANQVGKVDILKDHLNNVALRSSSYAKAFNASDEAYIAGLLHDLGKYGELFQRRLKGLEKGIDHWSSGSWKALENFKNLGVAMAVAIQGHHIGLQQANKDSLYKLDPKHLVEQHPDNLRLSEISYDLLIKKLNDDGFDINSFNIKKSLYSGLSEFHASAMLDIRMLYSTLVDADFIETEAHFNMHSDGTPFKRTHSLPLDAENAYNTLCSYLEDLSGRKQSSINIKKVRTNLLKSCLESANLPRGLFTLTSPTGSGKILSMLAFALKHAMKYNLRRLIFVLPYLNIIEQTVKQYKDVFKSLFADSEILDRYILEHHSMTGLHDDKKNPENLDLDNENLRIRHLLTENWDAPIIITTSVQFFESLFSNRPSACRKLHNLAKSVILFDEVQTFKTSLAIPTLATLSRLSERYGSTIVYSTATQPAFSKLHDYVKEYCKKGWEPKEIVDDQQNLFNLSKRTKINWQKDVTTPITWDGLAEKIATRECNQVLCIVNLKRHALSLFNKLEEMKTEGLFHLSTNMCPTHRQAVLKVVKDEYLAKGRPCRLISTQCVEAGVDVDFPIVYRAWCPLDAIAQAAGRCNRNGKSEIGNVHVFVPEDDKYPDGVYQQAAGVTRLLYKKHGTVGLDINNPELYDDYYQNLYDISKPEDRNEELKEAIKVQDFKLVAEIYRLIDKAVINVIVPYEIDFFEWIKIDIEENGLTKKLMAKASPYTVGIYRPKSGSPIEMFIEPVKIGRKIYSEDWFFLIGNHYDPEVGLDIPESTDVIIA